MKTILTLVCCLISWTAQAQVVDEKAKTLLDAVKNKYAAYNSIQVGFTMTLNDKASGIKEDSDGQLYQRGKSFKLDFNGNEIITNGKDLWIFIKESNQVQIQQYDEDLMETEFGFAPNDIFGINKEEFDYRLVGDKTIGSTLCSEMELSPKDKEKFYYKIKLYVSKTNNEVIKAHFYEKDGVEYEFLITKQVPNPVLADNFFTFDKTKYNKDIKIEDLR